MSAGNALEADWSEPWRDEHLLRKLYWEDGSSSHEIADDLNCSYRTVLRWMEKYDIPRRDQAEATSRRTREEHATHRFTTNGYERWVSYHDGERLGVYVHQLLACLDHDPYEVFDAETHVHHVTGHGLDNRAESLELLTASEHSRLHADGDGLEQG